jgi:transposase-like protein
VANRKLLFDTKHAAALQTEKDCVEYLESVVWSDSPSCPKCSIGRIFGVGVMPLRFKRKVNPARLFMCKACRAQFTVFSGTVFERTHLPLRKWFSAIALVFDQPAITVKALQRQLLTTYKTAWIIRKILRDIPAYQSGWLLGLQQPTKFRRKRRWIHPLCLRGH